VDLRRSAFELGHADTRQSARSLAIRQVSVTRRANVHGIVGTGREPGLAIGQRAKRCAQLDYSLMAVLRFSRSLNCPKFTPAQDRCGSASMQRRSTQPTSGSATARAPNSRRLIRRLTCQDLPVCSRARNVARRTLRSGERFGSYRPTPVIGSVPGRFPKAVIYGLRPAETPRPQPPYNLHYMRGYFVRAVGEVPDCLPAPDAVLAVRGAIGWHACPQCAMVT
jgi:hypothetical protein